MITQIKKIIPNKVKRNIKAFVRNIADSFLYYIVNGRLLFDIFKPKKTKFKNVIFVCKGNVCRSAFAEYRFRNLVNDKTVVVDSCGIDESVDLLPIATRSILHKV